MSTAGGRFDFDDGGTYAGGWEDGKANGFGVCTGPKGQGEYAGAWHMGFETSGVYTWSSGNNYKGQWMQGKRHGVGVEVKGRWIYQGEWTQGFKGRYGIRQSTLTGAKYEGTWTTGLQDGYGVETYADGGIYQGQWLRGIRHGYGVRQSVPYGLAARHQQKMGRESLTSLRSEHEEDNIVKDRDRRLDEKRGGFILSAVKAEDIILPIKKRSGSAEGKSFSRSSIRKTLVEGLKLRKQKSTGDIQDPGGRLGSGGSVRSTVSNISQASYGSFQSSMTAASAHTDSNTSFVSQDEVTDVNMIETYTGEWKSDKRSGFGVSERSDGLKYEGEWDANKRHGYGSTTFRDGTKEEGKYKNNVLISSGKKSKLLMLRANKLRDRVVNAVTAARSAAQIALQKSDIAVSRMTTARSKAELAVAAVSKAQTDSEKARVKAAEFAPDFMHAHADKTTEPTPTRSPLLSFGDHYDISPTPLPKPDTRSPLPTLAAKSILQRVANITGVDKGHQETRKPPPSIASALMSVAVDSSGPLVKTMNQGGAVGGLAVGLGGLAVGLGGALPGMKPTTTTTLQSSQKTEVAAGPANVSPDVVDRVPTAETSKLPEHFYAKSIDDHFEHYQTWSRPPSVSSRLERQSRPRNPFGPSAAIPEAGPYPQPSGLPSGGDPSRPPSTMSRRQTLTPLPQASPLGQQLVNGGLKYPLNSSQAGGAAPTGFFRNPVSTGLRRATGAMGSMPDVPEAARGPMPREEVHLMSLRRREEIRREREAEARRRQEQVVLSFGEFKEWCKERQLVVLVLAVNISLATMFFNLLST